MKSFYITHWSCVRGWFMRLLWAYEHDIAAISPFLSERIGTLCRHPSWSLWLEQRTTGWCSGRSEGHSKSFSAELVPTDLLLLTQRASRPAPGWFCWFFPRDGQHIIQCAARRQYIDRSIWGWVYVLWGWRCGGAAPLGCCRHCRTGPRADGHACPGSREHRAGGQQTTQSRALAAGWLVSRSGTRLTTAPYSGAFLPGGAWGADEVVDGPFHGQKPLVCLLRPHYPRRRGCQGVLSCARRLLSSWQRMQSSRSLQPRWGRGFTALTSSYPRKAVVFDQSWICDSWTGPCTGSHSRCWHTGVWSNAYSPGIGLQRSTWRMLTFMFRSFADTDRSYGLRSKVGRGSTGSSPSGFPSLPVSSRRS